VVKITSAKGIIQIPYRKEGSGPIDSLAFLIPRNNIKTCRSDVKGWMLREGDVMHFIAARSDIGYSLTKQGIDPTLAFTDYVVCHDHTVFMSALFKYTYVIEKKVAEMQGEV